MQLYLTGAFCIECYEYNVNCQDTVLLLGSPIRIWVVYLEKRKKYVYFFMKLYVGLHLNLYTSDA